MSTKCPKMSKNVRKLSGEAENTIFRHFLDNFCLFGRCFCLVTLSNARPLQTKTFKKKTRNGRTGQRTSSCLLEGVVAQGSFRSYTAACRTTVGHLASYCRFLNGLFSQGMLTR